MKVCRNLKKKTSHISIGYTSGCRNSRLVWHFPEDSPKHEIQYETPHHLGVFSSFHSVFRSPPLFNSSCNVHKGIEIAVSYAQFAVHTSHVPLCLDGHMNDDLSEITATTFPD